MYLTSVSLSTFKAQTTTQQPTGGWITGYTVKNANNEATIIDTSSNQNGYILEGDELSVTATINISQSSPSTSLSLTTSLQHSIYSATCTGSLIQQTTTLGNFNPNSRTITFAENQAPCRLPASDSSQQGQ